MDNVNYTSINKTQGRVISEECLIQNKFLRKAVSRCGFYIMTFSFISSQKSILLEFKPHLVMRFKQVTYLLWQLKKGRKTK